MKTLDLLGTATSLTSTYLFTSAKNLAWPIGIIAILINTTLYWQSGIYGDMCLEGFYLISFCLGWQKWRRDKQTHTALNIRILSLRQWFITTSLFIILYLGVYSLLINFSNSTVPILDALTTALSITAQILLCYSFIENWIFWFAADTLYISLYASKNLPFHVLLVSVYLLLAVMGYLKWARFVIPADARSCVHT